MSILAWDIKFWKECPNELTPCHTCVTLFLNKITIAQNSLTKTPLLTNRRTAGVISSTKIFSLRYTFYFEKMKGSLNRIFLSKLMPDRRWWKKEKFIMPRRFGSTTWNFSGDLVKQWAVSWGLYLSLAPRRKWAIRNLSLYLVSRVEQAVSLTPSYEKK